MTEPKISAKYTVLINACLNEFVKKNSFKIRIHETHKVEEFHKKREADCTILTWNSTVLWSVSLQILLDRVRARSADSVKHHGASLYANFQPSVDARWQCENNCYESSEWTGSANVRANAMWGFWNSDGLVGRAPQGVGGGLYLWISWAGVLFVCGVCVAITTLSLRVCVTSNAESLAVSLSAHSMFYEGARPRCLSD